MKPLLIVDGYNVIGAWSEAEKKGWPLDESRDRLMRQLEDYAGFSGEDASAKNLVFIIFCYYIS